MKGSPQVLAETPESVHSIGRLVTAAYLWPVRNSFAHFVVAKIEGELKYFQAKSLKLVLPLPRHQVARHVILAKESILLPVMRGIRNGWSHMMLLHLGGRWLLLHHLEM